MTLAEITPVPIVQDDWEFHQLLLLYRERRPRNVLEIGTYAGGTLYHWARCARDGAHIVNVDMYVEAVDNRDLYREWGASSGCTIVDVVGDSNDPATAVRVREQCHGFDWLFVDAGHLEQNVRADVDLYLPMVRTGGVAAFHDIREHDGLPNVQVHRVWNELRDEYRSIEIANAGGPGIGVLFL